MSMIWNGLTLAPVFLPPDDLDCYLIGGSLDERFALALKFRRSGIVTDYDQNDSQTTKQRRKAWERACKASMWGDAVIYNLDDAEDRAYVESPNAFLEHSRDFFEHSRCA
jgi:hypothetical protein